MKQLYDRHILPGLVHLACSQRAFRPQRERLVPLARGRVLEVGIGSGLNLPYYDASQVSRIWGLDPSPEMLGRAAASAQSAPIAVELLAAPAEAIPLATGSVDTVLVTYALCTIPDPVAALREMARVLRPGGELLFCEHGVAPDASVRRWQERINPVWRCVGGGCNLNRDIPRLVAQGGFRLVQVDEAYIPGWRPVSYTYRGRAVVPETPA